LKRSFERVTEARPVIEVLLLKKGCKPTKKREGQFDTTHQGKKENTLICQVSKIANRRICTTARERMKKQKFAASVPKQRERPWESGDRVRHNFHLEDNSNSYGERTGKKVSVAQLLMSLHAPSSVEKRKNRGIAK